MRIVFMGTPEFAKPSLQALQGAGHTVAGVFTQPDKPAGRGGKITASPVKMLAESFGLPIFQPAGIKTKESADILKALRPECIVVVAFGQILPPDVLKIPGYGCINVHASLLPAYRGAAPVHWALINGEEKTGVTTMLMDAGLDTGDILLKKAYHIPPEATTGKVYAALADIGADLLLRTIAGLETGTIVPTRQSGKVTYAPPLRREDEQLDWKWDMFTLHNRIRGLNPQPGAFTNFRSEPVKIWQSAICRSSEDGRFSEQPLSRDSLPASPGQILALGENGLIIQTGNGKLEIIELQPAGRKRMSARDFFHGRRVRESEFFS